MSLPKLPLIDGCLFIDNSSWMECINTCTRYVEYRALHQRVAVGEKPSLNFGTAIHLGLEHRYRNYRNRPVDELYYDEMVQLLTPFFEEHPPPSTDWRTLNWTMKTLREYNNHYETEEFNLLQTQDGMALVELTFSLPLYTSTSAKDYPPIPVIFTGRIDLPIVIDDNIFVMDHKTTSAIGPQHWNKMRLSSQPRGYAWAYSQITGKKVTGYVINTIRSKEPPQYVTNGTETKGRKLSPAEWWKESFQRERFYLHPGELDYWKNNTIDLVEEFFWHYSRGYMPMKTEWCASYGSCPYYEVCRLAPDDRIGQLNGGLYTENKWSPLRDASQVKQ